MRPLAGTIHNLSDIAHGWDGTFRCHDAPEGVYIYLITVEDYNGHDSYFKGNVTVLK